MTDKTNKPVTFPASALPDEAFTVLFLRRIPARLRDRFKKSCMKRGKSMNAVIVELMWAWVRQDVRNASKAAKELQLLVDREHLLKESKGLEDE